MNELILFYIPCVYIRMSLWIASIWRKRKKRIVIETKGESRKKVDITVAEKTKKSMHLWVLLNWFSICIPYKTRPILSFLLHFTALFQETPFYFIPTGYFPLFLSNW